MVLLNTSNGPAEVDIVIGEYENGRLAVQLEENGELFTTLSANVPEVWMAEGEFAFKNYSENESFLEQFVAAGLVEMTGRSVQMNFVNMPICRLTQPAKTVAEPARSVTAPRPPTDAERIELREYLTEHKLGDPHSVDAAYIAVYDRYSTGGPGWLGKLLSVVWDGGPSFYDVFRWDEGNLVRIGREYDEKECDRCGAENASLCFNCWKQWSKSLN